MSNVTNVILVFATGDDGELDVNKYKHTDCLFNLVSVRDPALPPDWYGGTKRLKCEIMIGAINWLDVTDLVKYLGGISWDAPECVQLIVQHQDDERFRIIDIFQT